MKIKSHDGSEKELKNIKGFSFDLDDNILFSKTMIYFTDLDPKSKTYKQEISVSTGEFAKYYSEYVSRDLHLTKRSFRDFEHGSDQLFLREMRGAMPGPSWKNFVNCVNSGGIFSVITARGVRPETLQTGLRSFIENNMHGLSLKSCIEAFKIYAPYWGNGAVKIPENASDSEWLTYYLSCCRFYPCKSKSIQLRHRGEFDPSFNDVPLIKSKVIEDFFNHLHAFYVSIKKQNPTVGLKFGFSDDHSPNLCAILPVVKSLSERFPDVQLKLYYTETKKELVAHSKKGELFLNSGWDTIKKKDIGHLRLRDSDLEKPER